MITKNNKQIKKEELKVGDEIKVGTLFGVYTMIVERRELYPDELIAFTKSKKTGAFLKINDEGYWDSDVCFDNTVVCKGLVV